MDIGWFTGVLEAEGSISAQVYLQKSGFIRITPFIALVNTDQGILDECLKVMTELADSGRSAPRICSHSSSTNKTVKTIRLDGLSVKPVLEAILPHMRSEKRRNAEVLLKYLQSRAAKPFVHNAKGQISPAPITRDEVEMICSIRTHKAARSYASICEAPNII